MPDQEPRQVDEPQDLATTLRKLVWIVPLAILIAIVGIVLLALLGPAVGNIYSYSGSAL